MVMVVATGFFLDSLVPIVLLVGIFPFSRADTFGTATRNVQTNVWDKPSHTHGTVDHCASNEIVTGFSGSHDDGKEDRIYILKCTRVSESINE